MREKYYLGKVGVDGRMLLNYFGNILCSVWIEIVLDSFCEHSNTTPGMHKSTAERLSAA
jgi:hypothetical protein